MFKILVVDDEKEVCASIGDFFKRRGYKVFQETNPDKVIDLVDKEIPQIVILDVLMPKYSGIDILNKIRAKYSSEQIRVIMITHLEDEEKRKTALAQGADDYIEKPLNTEYLEEVVMKKILELMGVKERKEAIQLPKILIVEDEEETVEQIKSILRRFVKADIFAAYNGKDALKQIKETDFDLVVLDLKLPECSGIEILEKAKQEKPLPDTLVVTAYESSAVVRQALNAGAIDYLPKPLDITTFQLKVRVMLEKKDKYIVP